MRRYLLCLLLVTLCGLAGCGGPWSSGDRVLVAKFLYDSAAMPPQRYDVVVFKYPRTPVEKGTPKNYIKRLLGLPGEIIAIFFGRLYRYAPEKVPVDYSRVDPRDLWKNENLMDTEPLKFSNLDDYPPEQRAVLEKRRQEGKTFIEDSWKEGKFTILRKPLDTLMALRRVVYDNDKPAKDLEGVLPPRWQPWDKTVVWKASADHGFQADGSGNVEQWLRYQHILRPGDWPKRSSPMYAAEVEGIKQRKQDPQLITDFMGYNTYETAGPQHLRSQHWVGDLMLECQLTVEEPQGEVWLELSRGVDRFQAVFDLANGRCTLYRLVARDAGGSLRKEKMAAADTRVNARGKYQLRFANFDDRLTLWVDGDLPFGDGQEYAAPPEHGPDARSAEVNNDLHPASIASKAAKVQVHHLKLWRDTYYTKVPSDADAVPTEAGADGWSNPNRWGPIRNITFRGMYVHPGHYLCLGDNSPESSDSRDWGLVPERLLLGRALMVYFPLERMGRIK